MKIVKIEPPTPSLGEGIYTPRDISEILGIPIAKVHRWIRNYWDGRFGQYSWSVDKSKAVNFSTLIEFFVTLQLNEQGIQNKHIFKAHQQLSEIFNTPYPFANQDILGALRCDGRKLFLVTNDGIVSMDGSKQLNLKLIKAFINKIEFGKDKLPSILYPKGKQNAIVVDPKRQFGHPVINNTNVYPETVYNLFLAKEPIPFIAYTYQLTVKEVKDAIEYCKAA